MTLKEANVDRLMASEKEVEFDFQRDMKQKKKGPSSPTTVLTMAGLFVCGVTLMLSGLIVLIQVILMLSKK